MFKREDVNQTVNNDCLRGVVLDRVENVTFCFLHLLLSSVFVLIMTHFNFLKTLFLFSITSSFSCEKLNWLHTHARNKYDSRCIGVS